MDIKQFLKEKAVQLSSDFNDVPAWIFEAVEEYNKSMLKDKYHLVKWPESQPFMDALWFDEEAFMAVGLEEETGPAAYFIPAGRANEFNSH